MTAKLYTTEIAQGVRIRSSLLNPQQDKGVITAYICANSAINVTATNIFSLANTVLPLTFPARGIPRDYVDVKMGKGGSAVFVGHYSANTSGNGGFVNVMQREPGGFRQIYYYDIGDTFTSDSSNYIDLERGIIRPKAIRNVPLVTIRWSNTYFGDDGPVDRSGLVGTVNASTYVIDGYSHAAETLMYNGQHIQHFKYGGIDKWVYQHTATYDPNAKHRDPDIKRDEQRDDGTWTYTLPNDGDGEQNNPIVEWPDLP